MHNTFQHFCLPNFRILCFMFRIACRFSFHLIRLNFFARLFFISKFHFYFLRQIHYSYTDFQLIDMKSINEYSSIFFRIFWEKKSLAFWLNSIWCQKLRKFWRKKSILMDAHAYFSTIVTAHYLFNALDSLGMDMKLVHTYIYIPYSE